MKKVTKLLVLLIAVTITAPTWSNPLGKQWVKSSSVSTQEAVLNRLIWHHDMKFYGKSTKNRDAKHKPNTTLGAYLTSVYGDYTSVSCGAIGALKQGTIFNSNGKFSVIEKARGNRVYFYNPIRGSAALGRLPSNYKRLKCLVLN